jgi:hypothetical protein
MKVSGSVGLTPNRRFFINSRANSPNGKNTANQKARARQQIVIDLLQALRQDIHFGLRLLKRTASCTVRGASAT